MSFSQEEVKLLSKFVTNPEGNIYCIHNLPEEVIAVIFAYVSRSPLSFKTNLLKLIQEDGLYNTEGEGIPTLEHASDKAKSFHEKWTVRYGHSSVAEHAVVHVGIEKISRLASAELELSNTFLSFTEYSQRYQKPMRGEWYVPSSLTDDEKNDYIQLMNKLYDVYEELVDGLQKYLYLNTERLENESEARFLSRIEKIAFEDARYVLPLAMYTNLGMTGNGRAVRDSIVYLLSSCYDEVVELGKGLETEVSKILPTLLRYTKPSEYLMGMNLLAMYNKDPFPYYLQSLEHEPRVKLLSHSGYDNWIFYQCGELSRGRHLIDSRLGPFDNPTNDFHFIKYVWSLTISEANWHQLLRHNRKSNFVYEQPNIYRGYTVPPNIKFAGLENIFDEAIKASEQMFYKLMEADRRSVAPYVVTNAHNRKIIMDTDLWAMYHLINLRTTPEAQWEIRDTVNKMYYILSKLHPELVRGAKRRG